MTDHTPQTTGERSPVYDQLIADRAKWVADFEAIEVRHRKNLADIDAAIAAVLARRTPVVGVERAECRNCGGWLVQSTLGPVHDRDGSPACTPGHSGKVAQPLDQTSQFPAVPAGARIDTTGWERSVCINCGNPVLRAPGQPWIHHFTNHPECREGGGVAAPALVYPWWTHRTQWSGALDEYVCSELVGAAGMLCGRPVMDEECPEHGKPAEVSDQTTATPAVTTVPDEAAQS